MVKKFVPHVEIWHSREFGRYNVSAHPATGTSKAVRVHQPLAVALAAAMAYAREHTSCMYVWLGPHPTVVGRPPKAISAQGTYWKSLTRISEARIVWRRK